MNVASLEISMKHHLSSLGIRALVCNALVLFGVWAPAQADDSTRVAAGREVAATVCSSCHGLDGNAPSAQFPKLAGQVAGFTALQLRNYRSGERPSPIMAGIAKPLTDTQIEAVAAYYASLTPMKPNTAGDATLARKGEQIYQSGKSGAPACRYCHGANGEGLAPVFPRLAGQHADFVYAALQPYKHVADFKNPYAWVMKAVVENWSDEDLKAVAAYVSVMR
jgi:cytochrome c553